MARTTEIRAPAQTLRLWRCALGRDRHRRPRGGLGGVSLHDTPHPEPRVWNALLNGRCSRKPYALTHPRLSASDCHRHFAGPARTRSCLPPRSMGRRTSEIPGIRGHLPQSRSRPHVATHRHPMQPPAPARSGDRALRSTRPRAELLPAIDDASTDGSGWGELSEVRRRPVSEGRRGPEAVAHLVVPGKQRGM